MRSPPNRKSKRRYRDEKIEPVALAGFVVSEFLSGNWTEHQSAWTVQVPEPDIADNKNIKRAQGSLETENETEKWLNMI